MSRKFIPAREAIAGWRKNPEFVAACDALEEEFALAEALIKARAEADLTLKRFAEATGTRLTIAFDKSPAKAGSMR